MNGITEIQELINADNEPYGVVIIKHPYSYAKQMNILTTS